MVPHADHCRREWGRREWALREFTTAKVLPELRAHQLSTLIRSVLMGFFILGMARGDVQLRALVAHGAPGGHHARQASE